MSTPTGVADSAVTPSAAAPTNALVELPGDQAAPLDATPDGPTAYGADAGTPGGDDAASGAEAEATRRAEDRAVLAAFVDDVCAHVSELPQDPIAGSDSRFRAQLIAAAARVFDALGTAIADPVAGSLTSPALTVRRALGLGPDEVIPPEAATRLLRQVMDVADPYVVDAALDWFAALSNDLAGTTYSSDPDASDAIVLATLADLQQGDPPQSKDRETVSGQVKVRFGTPYRDALRATRKRFREAFGRRPDQDPQQLAEDGQLAHQIIMAEYWATHRGHDIIFDTQIWDTATMALQVLSDVAAGNARIALVRDALVSTVTKAVGQPDILDVDERTVYEIKPITQVYEGAAQLGGRYLFFLNTVVFGSTELSEQFINALLPDGTTSWKPPAKFEPYKPGMWQPPAITPLPDGRFMAADLAAPGVIVYQMFGERKDTEDTPTEPERKLIEAFLLVALAVMAAGNRANAPEPDLLDAKHVIASMVTREAIDLDGLRELIRLTGAVGTAAAIGVVLAELVSTIELGELIAGLDALVAGLLPLLLLA